MVEDDNELVGLFRSETLLQVHFLLGGSSRSLTQSKLSVGSPSCAARLQGENGNTLSQVPGPSLQARRSQTLILMESTR